MSEVKVVFIDIDQVPGKGLQKDDDNNNNKYYYNDKKHDGERVEIILLNPVCCPGYLTLTYKPNNPGAKIIGITESGIHKGEFNGNITDCKSVTVYYWSGNRDYKGSLVVQLSGARDSYYTNSGGGRWEEEEINSGALLTTLDGINCPLKIHPVDISQKSGSSYSCPSCNQPITTLISSPIDDKYTKVTHSPDGLVGRLKDDKYNITNIPMTREIGNIYVYWYHKDGGEGKSFLICLPYPNIDNDYSSGDIWYKRESSDDNTWTKVDNSPPSSHTDCKNILKLLQNISGGEEVESGTGNCKEIKFEDSEEERDDSASSSSLSTTSPHRLSPGAITGISIAGIGTVGSALGYGGWKLFLFLKNRL
ncbi:hypothetical protein BEWA_024460 [Theileria equi strain WA]|uniref:Uncharacterized protein n=1 Tax=Theileria equi strain WA TaxID=1537102 RepID=L0AVG1_THEEQ|nr:hypothetical protein BEWA_024460 [Theileria equi strain WA]AFZ79597.1 hypothetical protein BEWA_024460 [Theileria equi strain WA]|eukprot:XP_004829263.1 hypothetical protein BEWA_024460 [Theileria equi strain WA]